MTDATSQNDPFAAARSNLRDTIKWLIAALAGLAAAFLGASPLTAFGSLAPGWRLYMAVGAGFLGLVFVFIAIFLAFRLLVVRPFFLSDLAVNKTLSAFIQGHASDLLPPRSQRFDGFLEERASAMAILQNPSYKPGDEDRVKALDFVTQTDPYVSRIVSLAYYESLRESLMATAWLLIILGICAVVALGTFAWAANPTGKSGERTHAHSSEH